MNFDFKQTMVMCLLNLSLFGVVETAMSSSVMPTHPVSLNTQMKINKDKYGYYSLQLGMFKYKQEAIVQYAATYKKLIASQTNELVHLVYIPNSLTPYRIVIGPFSDIGRVEQVRHQLLPERVPTPQKTTKKIIKPIRVYRRSKPITAYTKSDWTKIVMLSVGPAWSSPGKAQTVFLLPDIKKTYLPDYSNSSLISGEIFVGLQRSLHSMVDGQLGVAVAGASNVNLNGTALEDGNPKLDNYVYKYNINHAHVALKGRLLTYFKETYQPYISGSVGVGFNHAYDFTLTPKIYEEIPAPLFQPNTVSALTYTLGLGVEKEIHKHFKIGLGYEFADWGQSHLGAALGQTVGDGLSLSHLYTNQLQLSLTYKR
mgnify:CR=1 FL=1